MIGYFPTYTLGNLNAAQIFAKADSDLGDTAVLLRGDFSGRLAPPEHPLARPAVSVGGTRDVRVCGSPPDHRPLIASLRKKYGELYGLDAYAGARCRDAGCGSIASSSASVVPIVGPRESEHERFWPRPDTDRSGRTSDAGGRQGGEEGRALHDRGRGPKTSASIHGLFPLYWDDKAGALPGGRPVSEQEFLYQEALTGGSVPNPVGLDRGQLGEGKVLAFRRIGPRSCWSKPTRSSLRLGDRAAERRAVEESFARSVHWGFKVEAEEGKRVCSSTPPRSSSRMPTAWRSAEDGQAGDLQEPRVLGGVGRPVPHQGLPEEHRGRALLHVRHHGEPGKLVSQTSATGQVVSVRQRHSLVELPEVRPSGLLRRKADPRVGVFTVDFYDFSTPFQEPVERQWATRFRLTKKDPKAAVSDLLSRSSTTSTPPHLSLCDRRLGGRCFCGGPGRSRRPDSRTPFASRSFPTMPTRWTYGTT